jgi:hypothetical protein
MALTSWLLGAFAKLRKANISFIMSVRPSEWNNTAPTERFFMKFDIWVFFEKLSRNFKFRYSGTRVMGTLLGDQCAFLSYLARFFLAWKMFQTNAVEKIKTHFVLVTFFINLAVNGIVWKNTVERGRPQMTIWRMCIACWITKATDTHTEYVILISFPLQQWLHECASLLRLYIHCPSCYNWDRVSTARYGLNTPNPKHSPSRCM